MGKGRRVRHARPEPNQPDVEPGRFIKVELTIELPSLEADWIVDYPENVYMAGGCFLESSSTAIIWQGDLLRLAFDAILADVSAFK